METSTLSSISRSRGSWWWLYVTHKSRAGEVVPSVPCPPHPRHPVPCRCRALASEL